MSGVSFVQYPKFIDGINISQIEHPWEECSPLPCIKKSIESIDFNQLFAITNLPISRFLDYLIASENYEDYMSSLVEAFNPKAVANLMCTNTLSVSWDGLLYDCDFNQMLGLKVASPISHLRNFNLGLLQERKICISQHCYGCTAGSGSSCQGTVV